MLSNIYEQGPQMYCTNFETHRTKILESLSVIL